MGKEARIGLLLGATACLVAVMIDWVIQELWKIRLVSGKQCYNTVCHSRAVCGPPADRGPHGGKVNPVAVLLHRGEQ